MTGLGNNVHLFARPGRREALRSLFENVLQCDPIITVEHPGMAAPMLLIRFQGGGSMSVEFTELADDADEPLLTTWHELRSPDPETLMQRVLEAGLRQVIHPGHSFYFMAPGGQVFAIVPQ